MPDQAPAVRCKHHVHAAPAKPGSFVESVRGAARLLRFGSNLEDRSLRRRAAVREPKLCRLIQREEAESPYSDGQLHVEPASSSWCRDNDDRPLGASDLSRQDAVVEPVQACASPPPTGEDEDKRRGN